MSLCRENFLRKKSPSSTLHEGGPTRANFDLIGLPLGSLKGKVSNSKSKKEIGIIAGMERKYSVKYFKHH